MFLLSNQELKEKQSNDFFFIFLNGINFIIPTSRKRNIRNMIFVVVIFPDQMK